MSDYENVSVNFMNMTEAFSPICTEETGAAFTYIHITHTNTGENTCVDLYFMCLYEYIHIYIFVYVLVCLCTDEY